MKYKDYYAILGVTKDATPDEIKTAYRRLARKYHPDVSKEKDAEEKFKEMSEAYETLKEPEKRAAYDVRLGADDKMRFRIFNSAQSAEGVQAEVRKRQGILRLLYTKRLRDPLDAAMRGRDFSEMLGVPIEHLEFAL